MKPENKTSNLSLVFASLVGGIVAAIIVGTGFMLGPLKQAKPLGFVAESTTPTLDKLDTMTCPRGLTLVTQVRGQEDGFSRAGQEPAAIDPALRRYGAFNDLYNGQVRTYGLRSFDESGPDKLLIQHFDMPKGAVSGSLLLRVKGSARGASNDYVRLISSAPYLSQSGIERLVSFSASLQTEGIEATVLSAPPVGDESEQNGEHLSDRLLVINLELFKGSSTDPTGSILGYFNQTVPTQGNATNLITLGVYDDTTVDVAALALCVEPDSIRGVTFVEHSDKRLGPDMSLLSCATDETQSMCGPYTGDTLCSDQLPLACYKDGTAAKPDNIAKAEINDANFVAGEVRGTEPIAGSSFKTICEADRYCASTFGSGWRVLTYQEGGGGVVISRSKIEPKTRLWIDIRDQPRARCWDRPN
jgi:hypothetical protein